MKNNASAFYETSSELKIEMPENLFKSPDNKKLKPAG